MEVPIGHSYPRSLVTNYRKLSVLTIGIIIGGDQVTVGRGDQVTVDGVTK
jgi:hypothetical protein